VGQIADMTEAELLKLRNFGERSLQELRESLTARGVMWGSVAQPAPEADDEADAAAAVATAEPEVAAP